MDGRKTEIIYFLPEEIPAALNHEISISPNHMIIYDNRVYLKHNDLFLSLPNTIEGNELAARISFSESDSHDDPQNASDLFKKILLGSPSNDDPVLYKRLNIKNTASRCVVVFRIPFRRNKEQATRFAAIAPVESHDIIIPMDYHTVALAKDLESQSIQETIEFSRAIIGTMEEEGISGIRAGIGGIYLTLNELRESYSEALTALYLGEKYHIHDTVFYSEEQLLERIVDSISPERKREIRNSFRQKPQIQISEEIMETVRIFFQNDLNLTAASRQLFIHRNTLNYRLDKIKRAYGLDLRCFRDAVVFSIVSMILENNDEDTDKYSSEGSV